MGKDLSVSLQAFFRSRFLKRFLTGVSVLGLLYVVAGFFVLPAVLQSQSERLLGEKLDRQVHIGSIRFNPFTLTLDVHEFTLTEPRSAQRFVEFDALHVDFSAQSLLKWAPVIEQLRLSVPRVLLVRKEAQRYNIDDILALFAAPPSEGGLPRFAIHHIEIENGSVEFDDRPAKLRHMVSDIRLGVPFISSLPSQVELSVEPLLSARVNNAPFLLKGKLRPFALTREARVEFEINDLDLTRALEYWPGRPPLRLAQARLGLQMAVTFRQAAGQAPALVLDGDARVKDLQLLEPDGRPLLKLAALEVTLRQAAILNERLELERIVVTGAQADVTRGQDQVWNLARLASPQGGGKRSNAASRLSAVTLRELVLRDAVLRHIDDVNQQHATVSGLALAARGITVDTRSRAVRAEEISSHSASVHFIQQTGERRASPAPTDAHAGGSGSGGEPGYAFSAGRVRVANWSVRIEDGLRATAPLNLAGLDFSLDDWGTDVSLPVPVKLKARVNDGGSLSADGSLSLTPLRADLALDLQRLDLLTLQAYFPNRINARLTRGALDASGRLTVAVNGTSGLQGDFKGGLTLSNVAAVDGAGNHEFLRWSTLKVGGAHMRLQPFSLAIDDVALRDFFVRVIIDESGRINLQQIAGSNALSGGEPVAPLPARAEDSDPVITIRKFNMDDGRVRFTDNFIKPNYSASLSGFGGEISDLSSDPSTAAALHLRGEVNHAPLSVSGRINPLRGDLFMDVQASVRGMELAPLSPYSTRYIGYGIEKGKLSFEVGYRIEQRRLTARNRLILDQLTFGDAAERSGTTSLPVRFAVALLRDRDGVVDINLPIAGSFDDPQFSLGGLLFRMLGNVIAKAASQPFALLGAMFGGGGEELSWLEFEPGRAGIGREGEDRLQLLAKALAERPDLKLEITGRVDPEADLPGLKRAAVDRKVRALKMRELAARGQPIRWAEVVVSAEEYPQLLHRVYRDEQFEKPRNLLGLVRDLPVPEMMQRIAEHVKVDEDDLVALGNQRASTAKNWLVRSGQIDPDRIFQRAPKIGGETPQGTAHGVEFSLR